MLLAHMPQLVGRLVAASREGIVFQVHNSGPTPAYNVEVTLFFGTTMQPRSDALRLSHPLGPGDMTDEVIRLPIGYEAWSADKTFESQVRYNDAVGNRFMARLWHYRDWDEATPQSSMYRIRNDGTLENLTTNVSLSP
ncbi:MAG: hypothetical protein WEE53_01785 [Acidimicrobiia bacterium]